VLRGQTRDFIDTSLKRDRPFFAYVAPPAPHPPFTPAPRDRHSHDGLKAPRPPSFNERDVSDKPPWIRRPMLSDRKKAAIDNRHENRAETLGALDDLVGGVVNKLKDRRQLSNTYIVFTSDNGWHHGEHRIPDGKKQPYEESVRVPLLIREPGVKAGSSTGKLVLNTDYFPTFTSLAGIQTPGYVDGRSLRPVLKGNATIWRSAILLERRDNGNPGRSFYGIRTSDGRKYLEYRSGFREGYNLPADPYELRNRYKGAPRPSGLATRLQALKACAGPSCRSAENG
jgi:N-acetylglucosamine-6-sulfatase